MKRPYSKTADDVLVSDPEMAMRRTAEATRHILTVKKPDIANSAPRKNRKHKK